MILDRKKVGRPALGRNKRVAVSLDDELHALLSELSLVSESKISTIIYSILDESRGHFRSLIDILSASKKGAIDQAKDRLYQMALEMGSKGCVALEEVEKIQKEDQRKE